MVSPARLAANRRSLASAIGAGIITPGAGGVLNLARHYLAVRADSMSELAQFNTWLGASADMIHAFGESNNGATTWAENVALIQSQIAGFVAGSYTGRVDWAIPLCTTTQSAEDTNAGLYDASILQMARDIAAWDKSDFIETRPGWEFAFRTAYPWSASSGADRPPIIAAAMQRVVNLFRSVSPRFRFDWVLAPTTTSYTGGEFDPRPVWPGDGFYTSIGMDPYLVDTTDMSGGKPAARAFYDKRAGTYGFDFAYAFARARNLPFGIPEFGVNGDYPEYIEGIFEWARDREVTHIGYWNKNNANSTQFKCRLSDGQYPKAEAEFRRQAGPVSIITPAAFTAPTGTVLDLELEASKRCQWSVVGGANASLFAIVGRNQLRAPAGLANGAYVVTLRATDERGLYADRTFTITVQAGSVLPEAQFYAARCTTAPSAGLLTAISNLIAALKTADVWATIDLLYLPLNETAQAAQQNVRRSRWALSPVGTVTFTAKGGYKGDGSTGKLVSGFVPSLPGRHCKQDDLYMGLHSLTNLANGSGNAIEAGSDSGLTIGRNSPGQAIGRPVQASTITAGGVGSFPGFVAMNRKDAAGWQGFSTDGSGNRVMVTGSAASVHFIHEGFSLCGTLVGWGVNSLAVAILGSSKTQAQDAAIKNAVAAYVAAATA
ncbi:hypothetical protein [Aureimonas sp. ME7]|uniref:hypothetical protein n=1 Tax=Aureimonas sp. ME7 TaxID=2744252 RepID=UPI0015FDF3E0|nr:hypothetical protein [Aureimonas sp. ME7]